jgi:hypothetical protein
MIEIKKKIKKNKKKIDRFKELKIEFKNSQIK